MQGERLARRVTLLEQQVKRLNALPTEVAALRQDMDARFDAVHQVLISMQTQMSDGYRALEAKIDDNRRYTLVLHEEVISRIAAIGERWDHGRPGPRKKR